MQPLQMGVLAGMTPADVDISFYDDRMEEIPFDEPTDLAAVTVESFTARRAYEIGREYRERGVPVIMGGMHPTLIPDEVARYADSVFIGDAETLWPRVVEDARRGNLKPLYNGTFGVPQKGVLPRRDIFRGKGYVPTSLIQFTRGCKFECNFCATSAYFKKTHYIRDIDDVLKEVDDCNHNILFFVDDSFNSTPETAKAFLRRLIPKKIHWVGQMSIDAANDPELVMLMQQSGCLGFVVGFEAIYYDSLKIMNKLPNLAEFKGYEPQIKVLQDHGFQLWAAFTVGHDGDSIQSIEDTIAFAIKNKFTFAAFNVLMPYPNTPLYRKLEEENRLLYDKAWWLHRDYRFNYAAFRPKHMTADQLTEWGYRARTQFNSFSSIWRRIFCSRTNMRNLFRLGLYMRYNMLFRREVHNKQGLRLGIFDRILRKKAVEQ
jgi:radical SAM superfamily enzyme YgiQ (UPF0313 family)